MLGESRQGAVEAVHLLGAARGGLRRRRVAFQGQVGVGEGHRGGAAALLAQVVDQQVAGDAEHQGAGIAWRLPLLLQPAQTQVHLMAQIGGLFRRVQTPAQITVEFPGVLLKEVVGLHGVAPAPWGRSS